MRLATWGRKHAKALLFLVTVLCLVGAFLATQLPVSLFPSIDFPRILVDASSGDMPADEAEVQLTRPLEEALNAIPGVTTVRSTTSRGNAELVVSLTWGQDMARKTMEVQGAVAQLQPKLPPGTETLVRRMTPAIYPVIAYSLTSDVQSPEALRDLGLYTLRPLLMRVPGVSKIETIGGDTREYLVQVDPDRLLAHHLTVSQVTEGLRRTNLIAAVGKLEQNYKLYLTLTDGRYRSMADIGKTVLGTANGVPVTLDDVAEVVPSVAPQWIRSTADGHRAVLLTILQTPGGNTVRIADDVARAIDAYQAKLPPGVKLSKFYDQSQMIKEAMGSVRESIVVGVLLGFLALLLFLRNFRISVIAVASVPVTVAISMIVLKLLGQSFNIMTLGGVAAAVGLVIDDAIVMVENIVRHLHDGGGDPVGKAMAELFVPFLGSSATTIVVFAPMAMLSGVTGGFFKPLAVTMAVVLFVSLLLTLFIVPIIAKLWLKPGMGEHEAGPVTLALERAYARSLKWLLPRPWVLGGLTVVVLAASAFLYLHLPNGFLPDMDEGAFVINYETVPGTSLTQTSAVLDRVEAIIARTPEVASYRRLTGAENGGHLIEPNQGDVLVRLKGGPRRGIDAVKDDIRTKVEATVPGIRLDFAGILEDLIGDLSSVPQPIEIKVFGDDLRANQATARKVAELIKGVDGVVDVFHGIIVAGPAFHVQVDPVRASQFGLTAADVQEALEPAMAGVVPTSMLQQNKVINVRVQFPAAYRADSTAIAALPIATPAGGTIRLDQVADLVEDPGSTELTRENLKPLVAVTARLSGDQSLGGTIDRIKALLGQKLTLPAGTYLEYGGLYKEQQESFKGLMMVLAAAVLAVFTVILFQFGSFRAPVTIFWTVALSLFGVFAFLGVTHTPLNISSMMGMIMIVGIVAENGIFLLQYIEEHRRKGLELHDALVAAGTIRMRPIAMTTLVGVIALAPLALGLGAGAQMQQPLAIAVIGGFSLSALMLLLMLPCAYALLYRRPTVPLAVAGAAVPADAPVPLDRLELGGRVAPAGRPTAPLRVTWDPGRSGPFVPGGDVPSPR